MLAMTMRSWSRPVENVARDVLRPIVGELPAFYKLTTTLTAAGALAALAILVLTQTRPGHTFRRARDMLVTRASSAVVETFERRRNIRRASVWRKGLYVRKAWVELFALSLLIPLVSIHHPTRPRTRLSQREEKLRAQSGTGFTSSVVRH